MKHFARKQDDVIDMQDVYSDNVHRIDIYPDKSFQLHFTDINKRRTFDKKWHLDVDGELAVSNYECNPNAPIQITPMSGVFIACYIGEDDKRVSCITMERTDSGVYPRPGLVR